MTCYAIFAFVLALFGFVCLVKAGENTDLLLRYDDLCKNDFGGTCTFAFTPTITLSNPKIYYRLENFYANHRNFVKSRSYSQLRGNVFEADSLGICDPVTTNDDVGKLVSFGGTQLLSDGAANPCGLIAKYSFDDTFQIWDSNTQIAIDETNIAHSVDINSKFKAPEDAENI